MRAPRLALVAGETSGDQLGAALIDSLRARCPGVEVRGVCGPLMRLAGCTPLADAHELAVMGLVEVLAHLPRLLGLRRRLRRELLAWQPDAFIGIDAPEFNLGLAGQLRARGLRTVQYVSPQVWAWRERRVQRIAANCDLVLCLLPFEPPFYARHGARAQFVGHPLADQIPLDSDRAAARRALGLAADATVVALLPGSRAGEVSRLGRDFIEAAAVLAARQPGIAFIAPMASAQARTLFAEHLAAAGPGAEGGPGRVRVELLDGQARLALQAADAALLASGTASLEALLCRCPMVVAYRLRAATAFLLRALRMVRLPYFSLPNLLAGEKLVPEFFQGAVSGPALADSLQLQLADASRRAMLSERFRAIHVTLRCGGAAQAADAVLKLINRG
ncbi:MAG TPA: lipid-A-disaccharide synthase [Steroidobacteraceae bacterium]|nr:lipid-A-disaccharide synthase [Steroidobacteraceae bacterium]